MSKKKVKKEKLYTFVIPIDIYDTAIRVVVCEPEDLLPWAKKKDTGMVEVIEETPPETAQGIMYAHGDFSSSTIWVPHDVGFGTLSHEIFHAIIHVTRVVGIELTDESEEAFAHMLGYCMGVAVGEIQKEHGKRKKKKKKKLSPA